MRIMTLIILCEACVTAGCSREKVEQSAQEPDIKPEPAVRKAKKVREFIQFPTVSRQWVRTVGKDIPARVDNLPRERADAAKRLINEIAGSLLEICTNRTESEVHGLVRQLDEMTDGLGYNLCGQYLWKLKYSFDNFSFRSTVDPLRQPPPTFSRTISNYCHVASAVADLCWTKAGRCFQAQIIDHCQFCNLKYLSKVCKAKNWTDLQTVVDRFMQEWLDKRFDAPDCHLRTACDEIGEDAELDKTGLERPWSIRGRYDNTMIFYEVKSVGRYPKWLKGEVKDDEGKVFIPSKK